MGWFSREKTPVSISSVKAPKWIMEMFGCFMVHRRAKSCKCGSGLWYIAFRGEQLVNEISFQCEECGRKTSFCHSAEDAVILWNALQSKED